MFHPKPVQSCGSRTKSGGIFREITDIQFAKTSRFRVHISYVWLNRTKTIQQYLRREGSICYVTEMFRMLIVPLILRMILFVQHLQEISVP